MQVPSTRSVEPGAAELIASCKLSAGQCTVIPAGLAPAGAAPESAREPPAIKLARAATKRAHEPKKRMSSLPARFCGNGSPTLRCVRTPLILLISMTFLRLAREEDPRLFSRLGANAPRR